MKIVNRKAFHNYFILEKLEAGVVLSGFEVKSIRAGRVDLSVSFARIEKGEAVLKNLYIHHFQTPPEGYNPSVDRKLLLHKKQISYLFGKSSQGGVSLIPLSLYEKKNMIKVELALAGSKKKYDKRRAIKTKDEQRRLDQEMKNFN
jgi:SsrA-binding protein